MDMISKVGGAILLAETEWRPTSGVPKERAMALAAIEALQQDGPTYAMSAAGRAVISEGGPWSVTSVFKAMLEAASAEA